MGDDTSEFNDALLEREIYHKGKPIRFLQEIIRRIQDRSK